MNVPRCVVNTGGSSDGMRASADPGSIIETADDGIPSRDESSGVIDEGTACEGCPNEVPAFLSWYCRAVSKNSSAKESLPP
jgi:hypothetical protein